MSSDEVFMMRPLFHPVFELHDIRRKADVVVSFPRDATIRGGTFPVLELSSFYVLNLLWLLGRIPSASPSFLEGQWPSLIFDLARCRESLL